MKRVLYISYNGIREPLVRSQVLNYLYGLTKKDYNFVLLTFENDSLPGDERMRFEAELAADGIKWVSIGKTRRLGSLTQIADIITAVAVAITLCRKQKVDLVHARSLIPALVAMVVKKCIGVPFLFDIRGFWVDEKVYKGSLDGYGFGYRFAKRLEGAAYRNSDGIVSLTRAGLNEILKFPIWKGAKLPPMELIPTCVDLKTTPACQATPNVLTIGYVGSLGEGYLAEELFSFWAFIQERRPLSRYLVISRSDHEKLFRLAALHGLKKENLNIEAVEPEEVHSKIQLMSVGLSFIEPHYSKRASCPTKLGEYLAAGVPVIANSGIGDVDEIVTSNQVGLILHDFLDESFAKALTGIERLLADEQIHIRCRETAEKQFSLDLGVEKYHGLYTELMSDRGR